MNITVEKDNTYKNVSKEYIERDKLYKFIEIFDAQYGDNIVFTKKRIETFD